MSNHVGKAIAAKGRSTVHAHCLAMVHSEEKKGPQVCEYLAKTGDNTHRVKTPAGVICTAIFNPFTGLYYADDIYAAEPGGG